MAKTAWQTHLMKTFKKLKSKNKDAKLSDAMKVAGRTYKKKPSKGGALKLPKMPTMGGKRKTRKSMGKKKTRKNNEDTNLIRHNIMKEKMNKKNNYSEIYKKNKQKRTIRRSFTTGKSLKVPKISVLISNKKIRNNTSLKIVKTREKSIQEIKRELVKRGLIKVGTIAPNEVLRKMYETIELLCGDVQNYNSDTLLYNFMNDK